MLLQTKLLAGPPIEDGCRITFSHDDALVGCSHFSECATVWNTQTGEIVQSITDTSGYDLAISQDSKMLATYGYGGVKVSLLGSGEVIAHFAWQEEGGSDHYHLRFDHVGQTLCLVNGSWLRLWNVIDRRELAFLRFDRNEVAFRSVMLGHDFVALSIVGSDQAAEKIFRVTDISTRAKILDVDFDTMHLLSPDEGWIALGKRKPSPLVEVWDLTKGSKAGEIATSSSPLQQAILTSRGRYLIEIRNAAPTKNATSSLPTINVWDAHAGTIVSSAKSPFPYSHLRYSPSHDILALVANAQNTKMDKTLFVNPISNRVLGEAHRHPMLYADNHEFSPTGKWFATASAEISLSHQNAPLPSGTVVLTDLSPILGSSM